jgi:predicted DNA-binding protein (MmcQ/YjbR family)
MIVRSVVRGHPARANDVETMVMWARPGPTMHSMSQPRATRRRILAYALGFPEAYEDHPWHEDVAKVGSKVFVFLGLEDSPEPGMTVKLRESHEQALSVPGAAPTGYGLGRSGWVTIPFGDRTPPLDVLKDWVEESYRVVAPKRLIIELDERASHR